MRIDYIKINISPIAVSDKFLYSYKVGKLLRKKINKEISFNRLEKKAQKIDLVISKNVVMTSSTFWCGFFNKSMKNGLAKSDILNKYHIKSSYDYDQSIVEKSFFVAINDIFK